MWHCVCRCGGTTETTGHKLTSGHTRSCGCLKNQLIANRARKHGLFAGRRHPLIDSYTNMKSRCFNQNDNFFGNYGGRGITVCERWVNGAETKTGFQCFVEDMGDRPTPKHSLERIDNDGPYSKENCKWATKSQQARNRRNNRLVPYKGREISMAEFCDRTGFRYVALNSRLGKGWSFRRAITQPLRGGGSLYK